MQNVIAKKKKNENKPTELVAKSKAQGLPNKPGGCMIGAAAENQIIKHETKSILNTFRKKFFKHSWKCIGKTSQTTKSIYGYFALISMENLQGLERSN